jgi:hypothetical protein
VWIIPLSGGPESGHKMIHKGLAIRCEQSVTVRA